MRRWDWLMGTHLGHTLAIGFVGGSFIGLVVVGRVLGQSMAQSPERVARGQVRQAAGALALVGVPSEVGPLAPTAHVAHMKMPGPDARSMSEDCELPAPVDAPAPAQAPEPAAVPVPAAAAPDELAPPAEAATPVETAAHVEAPMPAEAAMPVEAVALTEAPEPVEGELLREEAAETVDDPAESIIRVVVEDTARSEETAPRTAPQHYFGDRTKRWVALTFDDGPSRRNTPQILDALRRRDVQATFFVLGGQAKRSPDLLRRMTDEGHELGNHAWSHKPLRTLWPSQIRDELDRTEQAVVDATGHKPRLFRPPFGGYAPSAEPIFAELELHIIQWSLDSHDWKRDDPQELAHAVVFGAFPGAIILLHDSQDVTAKALPAIVDGLLERDFEIVPVSRIIGQYPYRDARPSDPTLLAAAGLPGWP